MDGGVSASVGDGDWDSLQSCGIGYEIATYTYSDNLLSDITEDGFSYELILLDIEMPDVTGMELLPAMVRGIFKDCINWKVPLRHLL